MNSRNSRRLLAMWALLALTATSQVFAAASVQDEQPAPVSSPPYYDGALGATFGIGIEADGSARTYVRAADLLVDKRVTRAGQTTLVLQYGDDRVTFTLGRQDITVARGDRSAALSPDRRDGEHRTAVRAVLLGSTAVRAFRAFTAALEQRERLTRPELLATLLDGAIVGVLDGDEAAAERVARRIGRPDKAGLRQVGEFTRVQFYDCLTDYERALMRAWDVYLACIAQPTWLEYIVDSPFCALEHMIRAEQYIFQLIACMAIR